MSLIGYEIFDIQLHDKRWLLTSWRDELTYRRSSSTVCRGRAGKEGARYARHNIWTVERHWLNRVNRFLIDLHVRVFCNLVIFHYSPHHRLVRSNLLLAIDAYTRFSLPISLFHRSLFPGIRYFILLLRELRRMILRFLRIEDIHSSIILADCSASRHSAFQNDSRNHLFNFTRNLGSTSRDLRVFELRWSLV